MTKYTLKPLSNCSWILSADGERQALVSQQSDGKVRLLGKVSGLYENMNHFKNKYPKLAIEPPYESETETEQGKIEGYPVKHATWYNIVKDPLPSYTRSESSQIRYAAGYYVLKFPNGWSGSFCPKLTTLGEYDHIGPFTTKIEMQLQISSKNKTVNI